MAVADQWIGIKDRLSWNPVIGVTLGQWLIAAPGNLSSEG